MAFRFTPMPAPPSKHLITSPTITIRRPTTTPHRHCHRDITTMLGGLIPAGGHTCRNATAMTAACRLAMCRLDGGSAVAGAVAAADGADGAPERGALPRVVLRALVRLLGHVRLRVQHARGRVRLHVRHMRVRRGRGRADAPPDAAPERADERADGAAADGRADALRRCGRRRARPVRRRLRGVRQLPELVRRVR